VPELQYNGELKEILQRLAKIEQQISDLPVYDAKIAAVLVEKVANLEVNREMCDRRYKDLEAQIAGDRRVMFGISATVSAVLMAIKWAIVK